MNDNELQTDLNKYEVRVGHDTVIVEAVDERDAIEKARWQLCLVHPRLWDVIRTMDESRFEIARAA